MRQQVLDIQDASDIVDRTLIDGDTRIVVLNDALQHVWEAGAEVEVYHILTAGHHLLGSLVAETHDTLQHVLLFLQFLRVSQLKGLLQVVYTQHMVLLLHHLLCEDARTDKYCRQRIEQSAKPFDARCREAAEGKCVLCRIDFGHNLAKEQQEECQQNGNHKEL